MRKAKMFMLLAALASMLAGGRVAQAAAGVGLEWNLGTTIPFANFQSRVADGFTLAWKVTDNFAVGVFREAGTYRSDISFVQNWTGYRHGQVVNGSLESGGIRLMVQMPIISIVQLGIEAGTASYGPAVYSYYRSDGQGGVGPGDFGWTGAPAWAGCSAPLMGIALKITLLKGETKTVASEVSIQGAARFVEISDTNILGYQKVGIAGATNPKIDAIKELGGGIAKLVIGLWF